MFNWLVGIAFLSLFLGIPLVLPIVMYPSAQWDQASTMLIGLSVVLISAGSMILWVKTRHP